MPSVTWARLHAVATLEMGQSPPSEFVTEGGGGLPFLQGNADFGAVFPSTRLTCRKPQKVCQEGDVLISVRAPVGAVNRADQSYCIGRGLAAVRFIALYPAFGWHVLRHRAPALHQAAQGTTFEAIGSRDLQVLMVPTPSDSEQRRIAEMLDAADAAIAESEAVIAKLRLVRAGLLQDLTRRGLDMRGTVRDPLVSPDLFEQSASGLIPRGWVVRRLAELTTKLVDGVHRTPQYLESGVPFLTVENLTATTGISLAGVRSVSWRDHQEFVRRADPKAGDVLVTKDGTLGVARVVPDGFPEFSIFVSLALLRPNPELATPGLIATFFETAEFARQLGTLSAGTGLKHIHLEHFREFRLATPPLDEQHRVLEALSRHDSFIHAEEAYRDKVKLLKKGLMDDLLTGRVRVSA